MGNIRHNLLNHLNELGWMPEPYSSEEDTGEVTAVGDTIPPKPPQNVTANGSQEEIEIGWDEPVSDSDDKELNDLSHYKVYWSSSSGFDIGGAEGSKKVDSTLFNQYVSSGTTRYYKVTAIDETKNESEPSAEASATSKTGPEDISVYGWSSDLSFSATDSDTVEWTNGTLKTGDGQTFSINSGNTGNMSSTTYIYFDADISETELQTTNTAEDAVGGNQILIATASNTAGQEAKFQVFNGSGGLLLTADEIAARVITGNKLVTNLSFTSEAVIASGGYIESENYDSSTEDGFKINASGDATFYNITAKGSITITGGSGIGNLTDAGSLAEQGDADFSSDVTGAEKPENNATVGANWDNNLSNIPDRHTDSATIGLNLTASYLGYYDGSWQAYISGSDGSGQLAGGDITWDGTGNVNIDGDLTAGTITASAVTLTDDLGTLNDDMGTLTAGKIYLDGGDIQLGSGVLPDGSDGLYIQQGGGIEITDVDGSTIFNSNGSFQGTRVIDQGICGAQEFCEGTNCLSDTAYDTTYSNWKTLDIPSNKRWTVVVNMITGSGRRHDIGFYYDNADSEGIAEKSAGFIFRLAGYWTDGTNDWGILTDAQNGTTVDLKIKHHKCFFADASSNNQWSGAKVFWQVLEIPV